MIKPKVTIASISYNQEKFIAQALEGFVEQKTNFPFEVVISDDCSTDNTAKIIKEYAHKYPDIIKPIFREKNLGAVNNYIETLSGVKSEYVVYCEGDDYFTDALKLQKQVDFLDSRPDFSICFHPVTVKYEDDSNPDEIFPEAEMSNKKNFFVFDNLLQANFMQTNSVMYRWRFRGEEKLEDIFPKDILPCDWFLHLLHAQKGKIGFVNETMAVYRRHPEGIWWESTKGDEALHIKHGMSELNFCLAVEKQFLNKQEKCHKKTVQVAKLLLNIYLKQKMFDKIEKVLNLCPDLIQEITTPIEIVSLENKIIKEKKQKRALFLTNLIMFVLFLLCVLKILLF